MKFNGIIYMWTCLYTNKSYVGQTVDEKYRENEFLDANNPYTSEGSKIYNARKKYGTDKTTWNKTILERVECETKKELKEQLNALEKYYIEKYDTYNNGYNSTKGGETSYAPSEKTKKLISAKIKHYHSLNHHHVKKEVAEKISKRQKEIVRKNINSKAKTIRKLSVNQIDPKTNQIIKTFTSMEEAGRETNTSPTSIRIVCRHGNRKTAGGFKWEFSDENQNVNKKEVKGYYWYKPLKRWTTKIKVKGKTYTLGYFINENAAKEMYLTAKSNANNGTFESWHEQLINEKEKIMKKYGEA